MAFLVWTGAAGATMEHFKARRLAHFVDDTIDVLTSIRAACWHFDHTRPPSLHLAPTQWANGRTQDFAICQASAARTWCNNSPWVIVAARSLNNVRACRGRH